MLISPLCNTSKYWKSYIDNHEANEKFACKCIVCKDVAIW